MNVNSDSPFDLAGVYANLEKKAQEKSNAPTCPCGELLELINGCLHCWRCCTHEDE